MKNPAGNKREIFFSVVFLAAILLLILSGKRSMRPPDVIFITVDALRADHLGIYGYPRDTSVNIDALGRGGAVFLNCFDSSSTTVSALAGTLTGRYLNIEKYQPGWDNILNKKFETLAEYLSGMGYDTAAFLANGFLRKGSGFEQGFGFFYVDSESDAGSLSIEAIKFLKEKRNKPVFLWIHFIEPHAPYLQQEPYFGKFLRDELYKKGDLILKAQDQGINSVNGQIWNSQGKIPAKVFRSGKFNLNYYLACYDSEISHADRFIGELLANIKKNAIVVFSADHGESLGEGGTYFSHAENIYQGSLHIPLIIKDNRNFKGGKKISQAVSSLDIVPTILNTVDPLWYEFNKNKFNGLAITPKNKPAKRRYIYAYCGSSFAVIDTGLNFKFILNKEKTKPEELYRLPDETHNLINSGLAELAKEQRELKQNLLLWQKTFPILSDTEAIQAKLDDKNLESLKSLGYIQ